MLNRFQFARLRGFRRGKKRAAAEEARRRDEEKRREAAPQRPLTREVEGGGDRGSTEAPSNGATSGRADGGITDGWSGNERIEGLLRRHQEQRGQLSPETLGLENGATREAVPPPPTSDRVQSEVVPVEESGGTSTEVAERTRTVAAPDGGASSSAATPAADASPQDQRVRLVEGLAATSTARVVCIASGKGGTGKSVIASNLALLRARRGERVLLIDFDAGLANAHLLLGLAPPYDVGHVMEGTVSAREALVEGPHGLKLLAGGVGRQCLIDPTRRELDRLFKALRPLEDDFDLIVIDHGAGLSYSTVAHLAAASTLLLVTNHEVTALSDGYALYKRAKLVNPEIRVGLVVNRAPDERLAMDAWNRFRGASHKFLGHAPELIGWVPADPVISQAVQLRKPAVLSFPESAAAKAITRVAAWGPMDHARTTTPFYVKARRALR